MAHTVVTIRIEKEFEVHLDSIYLVPDVMNRVVHAKYGDMEIYARSGTELVTKLDPYLDVSVDVDDVDDPEDYEDYDEDYDDEL